MDEIYIERELLVQQNGTEQSVSEADVLSFGLPLVVLGDPGMGKTKLTESLAARLGALRVTAGNFVRDGDPKSLTPAAGAPLIIDGLDELSTVSGASAVDKVLQKLSVLGNPHFILSCRAADWNGSADRQKILEDYGTEPIALTLKPFSHRDAINVLTKYQGVDAEKLLDELDRRELTEFYTNPLTLTLVAAIAADKQGLPSGRADLLDRASRLLLREATRTRSPSPTRGEGNLRMRSVGRCWTPTRGASPYGATPATLGPRQLRCRKVALDPFRGRKNFGGFSRRYFE